MSKSILATALAAVTWAAAGMAGAQQPSPGDEFQPPLLRGGQFPRPLSSGSYYLLQPPRGSSDILLDAPRGFYFEPTPFGGYYLRQGIPQGLYFQPTPLGGYLLQVPPLSGELQSPLGDIDRLR